jgi:hypothetical protein
MMVINDSGISIARRKVIAKLHPDERNFLIEVCREVGDSAGELPVLYAGSGGNVEHAVLLGNNLVFVDSHLPEVTLAEIRNNIEKFGGDIAGETRKGVLGGGGKHKINFSIENEEFLLTYYAEDATKIHELRLKELENGYSVYFVKVPLPKENTVNSLTSPTSLGNALSNLVTGGYFLERECPLCYSLEPDKLGFKKITSGFISALSIYSEPGNLYKKVRNVDSLVELLEEDRERFSEN